MGIDLGEVLVGEYDWGFLCMPRLWPWGSKPNRPPPFFGRDEPISVLVAIVMGFQHALAMVGGIITVPLVLSGEFVLNFNPDQTAYLISAALICSGIASFIQVMQFKIPFTPYVIGSGLLSVMGISFTFLPIGQAAIPTLTSCSCQGKSCTVGGTCSTCPVELVGNCNTSEEAYGKLLGTVLVCCWVEVIIAFMPLSVLKRLFPPVVTGTTVMLIGVALCATGIEYWGGGAYCASQVLTSQVLCNTNGEVQLPYGSPQYVGLGFVVFFTLIFVEIFGSPLMRNIQVAIGLLVGMIVASATHVQQCTPNPDVCTTNCYYVLPPGVGYNNVTNTLIGAPNSTMMFPNTTVCSQTCVPTPGEVCVNQRYVTGDTISNAKWVTFLWVHTFPLGFYPPIVLPMIFGFFVTSMECIGDVTATTEASGLVPVGDDYSRSIQGGILADGLNCFWVALGTTLPCTTYAQNNGIISLTRCGARRAGIACACILFFFGIIQKFAAVILTIPDCVLGGMTSFLFINVLISGMRVLTLEGGINRRNRFIAALALTLGVGVELVPAWINVSGQSSFPNQGNFWPINPDWSPAFAGFRDALIIVMTTGFSIGGFTALLLNLILPYDADDEDEIAADSHLNSKLSILRHEYPHPTLENAEDPIHPQHEMAAAVPVTPMEKDSENPSYSAA